MNLRPHVAVILGVKNLAALKLKMFDRDCDMVTNSRTESEINVRTLGDINGDGIDDIAVHLTIMNDKGGVDLSKIYIYMGRSLWEEAFTINSVIRLTADMIINLKGYGDVILGSDSFDPKIGDLDNDGYYDFMLMGDDGTTRTVYFFFGKDEYSKTDLALTPDSAGVIWTFKN